MKLYLDNKNRIMAVNSTDRTDLTEITVDDSEFMGWSDVRICCYKIGYTTDEEGVSHINMMTPYVPTHMMSAIEQLDEETKKLEIAQTETEISITDMDLQSIETEQAITELDLRVMALEG